MTPDTHPADSLHPEWERLYLLSTSAIAARQGQAMAPDTLQRLQALQHQVQQARTRAPWQALVEECQLSFLDQDIAACTVAPEAEPRVGWLFHELQTGAASPYPTPALIHELLAMDSGESGHLESRLQPSAPLRHHRLIDWPGDLYHPVRSTTALRCRLLQRTDRPVPIIGATEIHTLGTWDQLVLPPHQMARLREIVLWETQRAKVIEEWGARILGGPVALFCGPSGTGKTFAAEGLAHAVGKRLFRVDLGLLVSKYIGETEKNLNALFDSAAAADVVLLFDEADSLFGKRGNVRDARDRYANMEVSHLLTRIERHRGICILTSNLRQNLDSAFTRRFHFVIDFPRPSGESRRELWRLLLPPQAPRARDVDLSRIAHALTLTGGQIRNAALHAAFLAAGDEDVIHNRHIASAIWSELGKRGDELLPSRLGYLHSHLPSALGDQQ